MFETILMMRPLIAILVSMLAAALILVFGERITPNCREGITFGAAIIKAACVFSMVPAVLAGTTFDIEIMEIVEGVTLALKVDSVGMVFACVASGLWILTSVYSIGYMRGHGEQNQTGYFAAFAMCLSGAIGICFAANLFTFFVFYEILTVATYPLVVHYRDDKGKSAGRKYLLYTLGSGQLFFVAMVFVYFACGTLDFAPGGFIGDSMSDGTALLVFFLMIAGGAVKAGVMPLHSWLPAAMVAPTPVSALLHAVAVVKAGAFCVIRIVGYTFGPALCESCGATDILVWFAAVTIILSSLIAIQKDNLKARLAFSTVGQLSYIVLGVCILTPISMTGAIYHIVAHAFMKITLFMCAGAIFVTTHKSEISDMRGIGRRMPVTMTAFTLASLGIAGLPFMVGFVSKMSILQGAAQSGQLVFMLVLVASALLSLTYLVPVCYIAFTSRDVNPAFEKYEMKLDGEASKAMLVPLVITAVISVVLGISPDAFAGLFSLAEQAAAAVFEGGL
ncbi:MAG: monovalent cation/H+ antiporter subunit D family protein [Firmicutes bacterium]|nr:monovalent cation/H+ antiporter subunit D family protein [Bacillota bacterium]